MIGGVIGTSVNGGISTFILTLYSALYYAIQPKKSHSLDACVVAAISS